jgi:hypothetical protein
MTSVEETWERECFDGEEPFLVADGASDRSLSGTRFELPCSNAAKTTQPRAISRSKKAAEPISKPPTGVVLSLKRFKPFASKPWSAAHLSAYCEVMPFCRKPAVLRPARIGEISISLCVQRQAAAVRTFLHFFGSGVFAFEVSVYRHELRSDNRTYKKETASLATFTGSVPAATFRAAKLVPSSRRRKPERESIRE